MAAARGRGQGVIPASSPLVSTDAGTADRVLADLARTAAAQAGAESTDPLVARKGRASYLGERAIGHRDPGSVSTVLLLRAAAEAAA